MKEKLSLIIPCYNEEEVLPLLYKELCSAAEKMEDSEFEFLFVDDGSKDKTLGIIKEYSLTDERVKYVSFSRNFGKEAAMYAGFCEADGDYVAVMDADLQDPPSLLPEMLRIIKEDGYDSVATRRVTREGEPKIRSIFARMFYKIINRISDADIVDGARDFRLMKRDMVNAIVNMCEYNRFSKGIFGWIGFKTYWLPFQNVERAAGETKWSFWKLFKYSLEGIINFSQTPLNIASWIGIFFTVMSFVGVAVVFIRRLFFDDPVQGWASLVCFICIIGGIQLFCMGVIGQYLAKTYMEVKKRPIYVVRETNKRKEEKPNETNQ